MMPNDTLIFAEGLLYGVFIFYCIASIIISLLINLKGFYYFSLFLLSGVAYNFVKSTNIRYAFYYFPERIFEFAEHYLMIFYLLALLLFIWYYLNNRYNIPAYIEKILQGIFVSILLLLTFNMAVDIIHLGNMAQWRNDINGWVFQGINILLGLVIIIQYPKLKDKQLTIFAFLYFGLFSILFFNPEKYISTLFNKWVEDYFLYSGGLLLGIILLAITILRAFYIRKNNSRIAEEIKNSHLSYAYTLIQGRQEERRRFAEELHDHIGIALTTLKINSSKYFANIEEQKFFNKNIDILCKNVRTESHELLPPTLTKLGLDKALQYYSDYKNSNNPSLILKWNLSPVKLSGTPAYVVYYILTKTLDYIYLQKDDSNIRCTIMQFETAKFVKIQIQYSGLAFDKNHAMISSTKSLLQLLNGIYSNSIKNIWENKVDIEIPYI